MQKIKVRVKKSVKKVESKPLSKGDKVLVSMAEAGGEYGKGRLKDVADNIKKRISPLPNKTKLELKKGFEKNKK